MKINNPHSVWIKLLRKFPNKIRPFPLFVNGKQKHVHQISEHLPLFTGGEHWIDQACYCDAK